MRATISARPGRNRVLAVVCALIVFGCAAKTRLSAVPAFDSETQVALLDIINEESLHAALRPSNRGYDPDVTLIAPVSIAVTADGGLFIADRDTGRILRVRSDGSLIQAAGSAQGISSVRAPRFIRLDLTGILYAADGIDDRVRAYDPNLRLLRDLWPPYDALNIPLGQIAGLAFGTYDEFYMTDQINRRVYRFDATGRFLNDFGADDTHWARLSRPGAIACASSDGSVYIVDAGERRVTVFDNAGLPLHAFGASDLVDPTAVAVDHRSQVYVGDPGTRSIHVFSSDGNHLGIIDAVRIGLSDFGDPSDVVVRDSTMYVAEPSRGRVLKLRLRPRPKSP